MREVKEIEEGKGREMSELIIKPLFCMCHRKIMGKKAIMPLICSQES